MTSSTHGPRRRTALHVVALAAALPLLAAGCGDNAPASSATPTSPARDTGSPSPAPDAGPSTAPVAPSISTYEPFGEGGDQALLSGTLAVDDGGCAVVMPHEEVFGRSAVLPIFPAPQVTVIGHGLEFRGTVYEAGDPIELGGGFIDATEFVPDLRPDVPAACHGVASHFMVSQE